MTVIGRCFCARITKKFNLHSVPFYHNITSSLYPLKTIITNYPILQYQSSRAMISTKFAIADISIAIWIQQLNRPANDPRYSVGIYLFCIGLFIPISGIAFTILLYYLNKGYFHDAKDWISNNKSLPDSHGNLDENNKETLESPLSKMDAMKIDQNERVEVIELIENNTNYGSNQNEIDDGVSSHKSDGDEILNNVTCGYWHWIIIIGVLSGIQNGMLPSISSFALLPYGNTVYILSTTLNNCFSPLFSLLPAVISQYILNTKFIIITSFGWLCCALYIFIMALQSPNQIGLNGDNNERSKEFWSVIMIIVYVSCGQLITICKTCIYLIIKKSYNDENENILNKDLMDKGLSKLMEIVGYGVQGGSFCGAVIFFLLINIAHIFEEQY